MSNKMTETISVNHSTFQTLAIQSLRYCRGRMTYVVSDCADFIRQHWQDFSQNTKKHYHQRIRYGVEVT